MQYARRLAIALLTATWLLGASTAATATCQSLSGKTIGKALIVETNDIKPPFIASSMNMPGVTVNDPFCRVRGLLRPTPKSEIYFEVWLPRPEVWSGRYEGNAPGGFAGSMLYEMSQRGLHRGSATSTTDNGHVGSDAQEWAIGHPERVADWGWRAVHETAVASKAIIAAYYGNAPKFSYYIGCSKGGGSGITEAQRYPDDYDGIVASAMGWDHSGQLAKYVWNIQTVQAPGAWISPAKLAMLNQAVLSACPSTGGYLDDPSSCTYDPVRLQCKHGDQRNCLTAQQVIAVQRIYSGPTDVAGKSYSPGSARGSELSWSRMMMGPEDKPGMETQGYNSGVNMVRALLFEDPSRSFSDLDPEAVLKQARAKLGPDWDATNFELTSFSAAGGKLISFHGWSDPNVPPAATVRYYEGAADKAGGVARLKDFYRLFMGPGMEHCGGGPGPNAVGGAYGLAAPADDPEHDVVAALVRWREQGVAPEELVATHYQDNDPAKPITEQRPWCAYPATARYKGSGNKQEAANWSCVAAQSAKKR
jgi:feruloyl esterase